MLGNSSELFVHRCVESEFMDTVEAVVHSQRTTPLVRERLLEVIAAAAYASSEIWHENESTFRVLWRKVKPAGLPDVVGIHPLCLSLSTCWVCFFRQGVPYGFGSAIFKSPSSAQNTAITRIPRDPPVHPQSPRATAPKHTGSRPHAVRVHRAFDEGRAPSAQRNQLVESAQALFECPICMDEIPANLIARIDSCGHAFCRECLRGHVTARLDERKFPVLCPTCTCPVTKGKGKGKIGGTCVAGEMRRHGGPSSDFPSEVSQSLAQSLGLTDKQHNIWMEMEMVPFSVLLHCRR
jgi:hypothetical protein